MKGLVIWAQSYCRSTLALYISLGNIYEVPYLIIIRDKINKLREQIGYSNEEFDDSHIVYLDSNDNGMSVLNKYCKWNHLFSSYQHDSYFQNLIKEAIRLKVDYAIGSEAPCNMTAPPKRYIKEFYIKFILPLSTSSIIKGADFIINYSGNDDSKLLDLGWEKNKIIPFGYYSPKLKNSRCNNRNDFSNQQFSILLTGLHEWHRSPMLLLKALNILSKKGIKYTCNITQDGPLLKSMYDFAIKNNLTDIHFLGFQPMDNLMKLYETCSVFIGCGNYEPWGIRLNDALQCGAPLIVNAGMGGNKLIEDYNCGVIFKQKDYMDLADKLERLILSKDLYFDLSKNAYQAAQLVKPENMAVLLHNIISERFNTWK